MQGEELKRLRKGAGMTQAEFGEALGLSGPFVGEMERDEKPIEFKTAALARARFATHVTVGEFGERFVVIVSGRMAHRPGQTHVVQPTTHPDRETAEAAARTLAEVNRWQYLAG